MMCELRKLNLGFREVEEFNLGLKYHLKSQKMKDAKDEPDKKLIKAAMDIKYNDEVLYNKEQNSERNNWRRWLNKEFGANTKPNRRVIKFLQMEARKEKEAHENKYKEKINHLRNKYREDEEEKLNKVPTGLEGFKRLSIFDKVKFANITAGEDKTIILGDHDLDQDEKDAMKLPPKFGIMQNLPKDGLAFDQELCYAKIRMEIHNELNEEMQGDLVGTEKKTKEATEEQDARSRMIYDPEHLTYNDHNRRATDLAECTRVTLPKPLPIQEEAKIELRREMHNRIYQEYIKEFCNEHGDQKTNLTEGEKRGIKKIKTRVQEGKSIVMKTDKSGKMCISTREKYIELGMEQVGEDRVITREELRAIEKHLNGHGMAWAKMWGTGRAHNQEDRIMTCKVSTSENTSDLYMVFKDHKKIPKGRGIATGNSGNTRALSNSVSDFVEAVATSESNKIEVISSEDMLHNYKESDNKAKEIHEDLDRRQKIKMRCRKCKIEEIKCLRCTRGKTNKDHPQAGGSGGVKPPHSNTSELGQEKNSISFQKVNQNKKTYKKSQMATKKIKKKKSKYSNKYCRWP